jgi:hypothetical protein
MSLAHQEIIRCVFVLKQQSFVLSTGHALTALCSAHRLHLTSAPELDLQKLSFDRFATGSTMSAEAISASKTSMRMASKKAGIAAAAIASINTETELSVLKLIKEQVLWPALKPHVSATAPSPMHLTRLSHATAAASAATASVPSSVKGRRTSVASLHPSVRAAGMEGGGTASSPSTSATPSASIKSPVDGPSSKWPSSSTRRVPPMPFTNPASSGAQQAVTSTKAGGAEIPQPQQHPHQHPQQQPQQLPGDSTRHSHSSTGRRSAILQPRPPPSNMPTSSGGDRDLSEGPHPPSEPQPLLFLSVNTHGLTGSTGWGTMSESFLPILETVSALLEANLLKWQQSQESLQEKQLAMFKVQLLQQQQQQQHETAQEDTADIQDLPVSDDVADEMIGHAGESTSKRRRQLSMIPGGENEDDDNGDGAGGSDDESSSSSHSSSSTQSDDQNEAM